jgi:hypothetical protein
MRLPMALLLLVRRNGYSALSVTRQLSQRYWLGLAL